MGSRKASENYDVLGSIFDFVFKETKKKPEKRQNVKASGIAGEGLLADALASTLENPGIFISDTILADFNDSLDADLAVFDFNDKGKIKVSTKSVVDFIKDPSAFVDKARARAESQRKGQRAKYVGGFINDYLTAAWSYKFANEEAQQIALANLTANEKKESYKISRAVGQNYRQAAFGVPSTDYDFMAERNVQLIGKEVFGSGWDSMAMRDKENFETLVSGMSIRTTGKASEINEIKNYLSQRYTPTEVKAFENIANKWQTEGKILDIFNPSLYKELERKNLDQKIQSLSTAPAGSQGAEKRKIYEKMRLVIERDKKAIANEISNLNNRLSSTNDPKLKNDIRKEIKDLNRTMRVIDGDSLLGHVGKWEGYINSLNTVWGGFMGAPNLVPSILNGDFFDSRKNTLTPLKESKFAGNKILVAKDSNRRLMKAYNEFGENLYYITPRSMLKTAFYNGEGFARLLYKNLSGLEKSMAGKGFDDILKKFSTDIGGEGMRFTLDNGSIGNIDDYVNEIIDQIKAKGNLSADELKRLEKMMQNSASLKKLTNNFSFFSRKIDELRGKITNSIAARGLKLRERFAARLLRNPNIEKWLVKSGASKLLGQWVAKGGLKTLVQSLVTTVAGAIGMVGTPLGSIIVTAVTWIATDLLMKALKVFFELGKLVILVAIAILVTLILFSANTVGKFNKRQYAYSNAVPDSVVKCSLYDEIPINPGDDPWSPAIIPPRSSQSCILGSQNIRCSQGFVDVIGWSHERMTAVKPVDLTNVDYIYAPQFCDTGSCSITAVRKINCGDGTNAGGVVILETNDGSTTYIFKLLHVQPLASIGEKLTGGQPVALVQSNLEHGWCWTGKHLHLETTQIGQVVDPLELLQSFNCKAPDETGCSDPR